MELVTRILLVEDDQQVRAFIESTLHLASYQTLSAGDGLQGVLLAQRELPHLIILDIGLPRLNGFQILERVRETDDTPIIMLTSRDAEEDKLHAFSLGADDYLTKPFSARELLARVQAVLRRGQNLASSRALRTVANIELDLRTHQVWIAGRSVHLSRTEFSLLVELARTPGRVCTDQQLLVKVWGEGYRDDQEILRRSIARLRQRLEGQGETVRYIQRQQGVGYLLQTPQGVD
jgi:two-component system, OmpR family, KDP operon response regulator KdpE